MATKPTRAVIRSTFEAELSFSLDPFQAEAFDALDAGHSVVVAAPTGSGKTVVAEYAVAIAIAEGKRAFYTAPIKALSNQKYRDLCEKYGSNKVGLLTGDTSINETASVVVMTTEVLRNMIHARSGASASGRSKLDDLRFVVMDEVHFLQDAYRGTVWEEVIISTPPEVDLVCLSATVSNATDLADWVSSVRGATTVVTSTERPVELTQLFLIGSRYSNDVDVYETFTNGKPNPKLIRLDAELQNSHRNSGYKKTAGQSRSKAATPRRMDIVEMLQFEDLLPAIYFVFSRAGCDEAMRNCLHAGVVLTHPDERTEIRAIVEAKIAALATADLEALDYNTFLRGLENGIAAHHAGMVPPFKEAVEACFTEGLVKVVFATETLALGINMPARSVVIEKLSKYSGAGNQMLTAGEFTQLTGRAGRRGLDPHGYAVTLWTPYLPFEDVADLASRRTYELRSAFRPTYNLAANLIRRSSREQAVHFLRLSFAQYQIDAQLVRSNAQAERLKRELGEARAASICDRGDIAEYLKSQGKRGGGGPSTNRADRRAARFGGSVGTVDAAVSPEAVAAVFKGAQPGAVLQYEPSIADSEERAGVAVISTSTRGFDRVTLRVLTISGNAITLSVDDVRSVPKVVGHIEVPVPFNPQSRHFLKQLATNLNRSLGDKGRRPGGRYREPLTDELAEINAEIDAANEDGAGLGSVAAVGMCPDLKMHLAAFNSIERLEREVQRAQKIGMVRSNSLVDQLDRVLGLLDDMGCVEGWTLTESGKALAGIFHECDLLVADCLRAGLFDGLNPPQMAALTSVFVHEKRGPNRGGSDDLPRSFPKGIADRWWRIADRAERLNERESAAELPLTRQPDASFAAIAHGWASGRNLHSVMATEEVTGGDLVRTMKALIDLLRQIGEVAPNETTRETARTAASQLFRGVVSISSSPAVVEVIDPAVAAEEEPTERVNDLRRLKATMQDKPQNAQQDELQTTAASSSDVDLEG